jgi:hypothetical protein
MRTHLLMSMPGHYVVSLRRTGLLHNLECGLSGHPSAVRLARLGSIFGLLATQGKRLPQSHLRHLCRDVLSDADCQGYCQCRVCHIVKRVSGFCF